MGGFSFVEWRVSPCYDGRVPDQSSESVVTPAPDWKSAYSTWQTTRLPEHMHAVVKSLEPTIRYSLASVNALEDPVVRSKAVLHTAQAIEKYNPAQEGAASLPTFVSSQLRQLSRAARQSKSIVKMPERIQLDAMKINHARAEYADKHGREPDVVELADFSGIPAKRIEKVGKFSYALPTEAQVGGVEGVAGEGPDFENEALRYVHHDADHTDRMIIEMKTGFGGRPQLSPQEIGLKLNLTPSQLSRRSARLAAKINSIHQSLTKI